MISLQGILELYRIGDVDGVNNSTTIEIDDTFGAQQVNIAALNGLRITGDTFLIHSGTNYGNGAGAALGTLANAPIAGNPTVWIPIDDNGTLRHIPAW